jgi:hypothetical protein
MLSTVNGTIQFIQLWPSEWEQLFNHADLVIAVLLEPDQVSLGGDPGVHYDHSTGRSLEALR